MANRFKEFAERAERIVTTGHDRGVELRSVGGIAVWDRMPDGLRDEFERVRPDAKDLDLVAPQGSESAKIQETFVEHGYAPDERLIAWRGDQRHQYFDLDEQGQPVMEIDVFLGPPPACHSFDLPESAFDFEGTALPSTELLLQKLQIVESSEKDLLDIAFLLLASDSGDPASAINSQRVIDLMAKDWGFCHTTGINLALVSQLVQKRLDPEIATEVSARVSRLADQIEAAPKSRKWKLRARVGTKVSWYEEVEELDR
jgi:hypothetical protein